MTNQFKTWMIENYSHNELADIANHGCSGGVSGMVYYTETYSIYQKFSASLHEALRQYKACSGEWPSYVLDELLDDVRFANALVWFAAEWFANEITQGEYSKETEGA